MAADTEVDGDELVCVTDSGVSVMDVQPGEEGSNPSNLVVYDDGTGPKLYFSARTKNNGRELHVYDGSETQLAADIVPGEFSSYPSNFAIFAGDTGQSLYFSAQSGDGRELHVYDGSSASQVANIYEAGSTFPENLTAYNDKFGAELFFVGQNDSGQHLFAYNASFDIVSQVTSGLEVADAGLIVYNDGSGPKLYFQADNGSDGDELYAYDGSSAQQVADINPNGADSDPSEFAVFDDGSGDALYFQADNGSDGTELHVYDGSSVSQVADISTSILGSRPQDLTVYESLLYFSANGTDGRELYAYTDFTGVFLAADIDPNGSSRPEDLTVYDDGSEAKLYFSVRGESFGRQLQVYDGSSTLYPRFAHNLGGGPGEKVVYQGTLYFPAEGEDGEELYAYDASGLRQVADVYTGPRSSSPSDLTVYDDGTGPELYFSATNGTDGRELYAYDGFGTRQAADIRAGEFGSDPEELTVYNGQLYFRARDDDAGVEPHVYDGSSAQLIADINTSFGSFSSDPRDFTVYDDGSGPKLYFAAEDRSNGEELYVHDGSTTQLAEDINLGDDDSHPTSLTVYDPGSGPILYFSADNGSDGEELYGYNGSSLAQIADINGSGDSSPRNLTVYDDGSGAKLYFSAENGSDGREPFEYDGTSAQLVKDINAGEGSSSPRSFTVYNDRLYFQASTPAAGTEPYSFDGTQVTTFDARSGSRSSGGYAPIVYDDGSGAKLYVTAATNSDGVELYRFSETQAPLPVELTAFEATSTGPASVSLTWTTASEQNNAGFRVQHQAADEGGWTKLGFVEGDGTTTEARSYRFEADGLAAGTHRFRLQQVDLDGTTTLTDARSLAVGVPNEVALQPNAPNPFRNQTQISFSVAEDGPARVDVYNVLGQRVARLFDAPAEAGKVYTLTLDGSVLAPGVYFYRLQANGQQETGRATLVR